MGAITSDDDNALVWLNFSQRRNLNTNSNIMLSSDVKKRIPAVLRPFSSYCRINTMTQKYAHSPSLTKSGMKHTHHDLLMMFSYFNTARTENTRTDTRCIHISNPVIRSQHTSSRNVKNMISATTQHAQ